VNVGPIRFAPVALAKVWGGRRLAERLDRKIPDGAVGECWEISARPEASTVAITGPRPGSSPAEILGAPFPLLVKTLDASDRLSVQVHPGPEAARILPEAESKHELWVVLEAAPHAVLWRGFREGTTRDTVAAALEEGTVETLLREVRPRPGDVIEIPPGTVHAIGPGCLLLEVQESSDTTYRAWDWNRRTENTGVPRPLHVEQALACFRYDDAGPARVRPRRRRGGRELLADGAVLRVERVVAERGTRVALGPGRVHVVSNVTDRTVRLAGDPLPLRFADSALLLPGEEQVVVAEGGPARLLLTSAEVSR
jgi:mannose-6-phosphate isomerase